MQMYQFWKRLYQKYFFISFQSITVDQTQISIRIRSGVRIQLDYL